MSNLIPTTPNHHPAHRDIPAPLGFSRSEARSLQRAQNAEVARGIVGGTIVSSAAYVAGVAVSMNGMLGREAQFQADGDPAITARNNYVLDVFAESAAAQVRAIGMGR